MKKNLTRILALVLVLALALTACGKKETTGTSDNNTSTGTTTTTDGGSTTTTDNGTTTTDPANTTEGGETAPAEEAYVVDGVHTYNIYTTALGNNWNPHAWETSIEDSMLGYVSSPFVTMQALDTEEGVYQWIYEMATYVKDVTAANQADLTKYNVTFQAGKTAADTTSGYVFEIGLNPNAKWQDGTVINADSYIYSMKALLDPTMLNYRANLFYSGESAVAGGFNYYNALKEGYYDVVDYATAMADAEAGKAVYIDCWDFWGAQGYTDADGNEVAQYVDVADTTVYGESVGDAFSGADLLASYGAYFEAGYYNFYEYFVNENYNPDYASTYDATVGCYKVDDYTIRYVTQTYIDFNYMLTSLTSTWLVYEPLYEAGKDTSGSLVTTNYMTNFETTMSYGPYKFESLQTDKQLVLVKNENWYGYQKDANGALYSVTPYQVNGENMIRYQADRIVIDVMDDNSAKSAFLKGELDSWTPSSDDLPTFAASDRLYKADETYTMSFFFDTNLDDLKTMDESKGNKNSVVMSNVKFRKAFSLSVDRSEWVTATAGYKPAYSMLNSLYFYDVYNDPTSSYRNSDEAMQAICNVYGVAYGAGTPYATLKDAYKSINGYNLTEAKRLMKEACDELVADGIYTAGEDIEIRIGYKKGTLDSSDNKQVELFNKYINAAAEGSGFGKITLTAVDQLTDRYGDVGTRGDFAIGYGAWGGAAFYPFRNFQVYCDPDQYSIHEGRCWDPTTETLTINVNGEDVTMTWQEWSGSMIGSGRFTEESFATKLGILATMEENYLNKVYRIPFASSTSCELISYKADYLTEDYNIMYGFGGLELIQFNFNDAEWAEYLKSVGGNVSYE